MAPSKRALDGARVSDALDMEVDVAPLSEPERLRVSAHLSAWGQRYRTSLPGKEVFEWLCDTAPPAEVRRQLLELPAWPEDPPPLLMAALHGGQLPGGPPRAKRGGAAGRPIVERPTT